MKVAEAVTKLIDLFGTAEEKTPANRADILKVVTTATSNIDIPDNRFERLVALGHRIKK